MAQATKNVFNSKSQKEKNRNHKTVIECMIMIRGYRTGRGLVRRRAFFGSADVARQHLLSIKLRKAEYISLKNQDLSGMNLSGLNLRNADLTGAICHNTNFYQSQMEGAKIDNADLTGARLSSAQLRQTIGRPYAGPLGRGITAAKIAVIRHRMSYPSLP